MKRNKNIIEVYSCGCDVVIKNTNIKAIITCQSIRFGSIQYELTYHTDCEEKVIFCNECQFKVIDSKKDSIGFKLVNEN